MQCFTALPGQALPPVSEAEQRSEQAHHLNAGKAHFEQVMQLIWRSHPRIRSLGQNLQSANQKALYQDYRYPDPAFGVAYSNIPYKKDLRFQRDRTPMSGIEFRLSQPIPFPGKLGLDADISHIQSHIARLQLEQGKNQLIAEWLRTLVDYHWLQAQFQWTQTMQQKIKLMADSARNYYAIGRLSLDQVQFASITSDQYKDKLVLLEGQLQSRQSSYRYFDQTDSPQSPLDQLSRDLELQKYLDTIKKAANDPRLDLKESSLTFALQQALARQAEKKTRRAQLNYLPDSELFASYRKREFVDNDPVAGEDFISFGITMKIPLWTALSNHKQLESKYLVERSQQSMAADVLQRESSQFKALQDTAASLARRRSNYRTDLLNRARLALESLQTSYLSGKTDLYDLLKAYDFLYRLQMEYYELEKEYQQNIIAQALITNRVIPQPGVSKLEVE
ncbi:MAG: TolC family protein [Leptospiraceae bacterium]|nr:TolC family protein [Leptospiraceae bacterium]